MIEDKKLDTPVDEKAEVKKNETPKAAPKAEVKSTPKKKTFTL